MPKYIKESSDYHFNDLLNDTEQKTKYSHCVSYTRGFPYNFYLWLVNGSEVVFFKRPQVVIANPLVNKVTIDFPDSKCAKLFATRYVDRKMLDKIFNKHTKSIII